MNGTIFIKSKINVGTSFVITLPFEKATIQQNTDNALQQKTRSFYPDKTILIVDDFDDNRF